MFSTTRCFTYLTALIALAANACSTPEARPASAPIGSAECQGGTVRSDEDAARYAGCQSIIGDLRITQSDLTDLNGFRRLRRVSGSLVVRDNPQLVSASGLKGVRSAGQVWIQRNPMLSGYRGLLSGLKQVDEPMMLRNNRGLTKHEVRALLERVEVRAESGSAPSREARL